MDHTLSALNHISFRFTDTPIVKPETELKGFKIAKQVDATDHHVRSTIVVLNGDKKVVGFIPHPEDVQGVVVG